MLSIYGELAVSSSALTISGAVFEDNVAGCNLEST